MITNRYLTKSRFKLAVECPTKLFYTGKGKEYKDAMVEDDFLAMLAEGGYQVGELAKSIVTRGVSNCDWNEVTIDYLKEDIVAIARAIEQALKEKNIWLI
jgi:hypothetical protein